VELARCLGLSVQTRYCLKQLKRNCEKPAADPDFTPTVIPSAAVSTAGSIVDTAVTNSVSIPTLPPRKRLKLLQREHDTVRVEDTMAVVNTCLAEMDYDGATVNTVLKLEQSKEDESGTSKLKIEQLLNIPACISHISSVESGTIGAACSSSSESVINVDSTEKNSFAALSVPWSDAQPAELMQQPVRCGRKPRQETAVVDPTPVAPYQNCIASNGSDEIGAVLPAQPGLVATTPTPNVIQIPADAQVLQTEDGAIIVCQSNGTVHIHGHAEGQPLPIDAIRSLLELQTTGNSTLLAVSDSNPVTQETSQSLCSQTMSLAGPQGNYKTVDEVTGTGVLPPDGRQFVTVDSSQALVAFDPNTQSMIHIDPGQTFITLADGSTLVAVDSTTQSLLSVDGSCYPEPGVVSNHTLMQLMPDNHMQ